MRFSHFDCSKTDTETFFSLFELPEASPPAETPSEGIPGTYLFWLFGQKQYRGACFARKRYYQHRSWWALAVVSVLASLQVEVSTTSSLRTDHTGCGKPDRVVHKNQSYRCSSRGMKCMLHELTIPYAYRRRPGASAQCRSCCSHPLSQIGGHPNRLSGPRVVFLRHPCMLLAGPEDGRSSSLP